MRKKGTLLPHATSMCTGIVYHVFMVSGSLGYTITYWTSDHVPMSTLWIISPYFVESSITQNQQFVSHEICVSLQRPNKTDSKDIVPSGCGIVLLQLPKLWGVHVSTVSCSIALGLCHSIVACSTRKELCNSRIDDRRCLCDLTRTANEPCKSLGFVSVFRDHCGVLLQLESERGVQGRENEFKRIDVRKTAQDGSNSKTFATLEPR